VDSLRRSIQSVRNLASRLPIPYHVDENEGQNNRRVVRFKDETRINTDVDHAENNA